MADTLRQEGRPAFLALGAVLAELYSTRVRSTAIAVAVISGCALFWLRDRCMEPLR
jgi:hypothetical protein